MSLNLKTTSILRNMILCISIILCFSSCSMEKKRYSRGYHVEWTSKTTPIKTSKEKQSNLTQRHQELTSVEKAKTVNPIPSKYERNKLIASKAKPNLNHQNLINSHQIVTILNASVNKQANIVKTFTSKRLMNIGRLKSNKRNNDNDADKLFVMLGIALLILFLFLFFNLWTIYFEVSTFYMVMLFATPFLALIASSIGLYLCLESERWKPVALIGFSINLLLVLIIISIFFLLLLT